MERFAHIDDLARAVRLDEGCVVCIGNFDGLHLGHRRVVRTTTETAREAGVPSILLTFEPHPLAVLAPRRAPSRLCTPEDRARLLANTGVDHVVEHPFDRDLASMPPESFVEKFIVEGLRARAVVVGDGFRFGRDRAGDDSLLQTMGRDHGFEVKAVPALHVCDAPVSSSRIRRLLTEEGDVVGAAGLLGRPHVVTGLVVRGRGRGRGLGFPTANLENIRVIVPRTGIYACLAVLGERSYPAAVHAGPRLTFDSLETVEAHLVGHDHDRDLYGETLALEFIERLRDTVRFDDPAQLVRQIDEDVSRTVTLVEQARAGEAAV